MPSLVPVDLQGCFEGACCATPVPVRGAASLLGWERPVSSQVCLRLVRPACVSWPRRQGVRVLRESELVRPRPARWVIDDQCPAPRKYIS